MKQMFLSLPPTHFPLSSPQKPVFISFWFILILFLLKNISKTIFTLLFPFTFLKREHTTNITLYLAFFFFCCIGSSLLRVGFLQLQRAGAVLHCGVRASHCGGFSCCGAQALGTRTSVVVARGLSSCSAQALGCVGLGSCGSRALEHRLSSWGAQAQLLHSMWDLPGPGREPVSPALAGGFLATAPPGKSLYLAF